MQNKIKKQPNKQNMPVGVKKQVIAPDAKVVLADSTSIAISKYDVKLMFAISLPDQGGVAKDMVFHTIVGMSPQLAKAFAKTLNSAIDNYEKENFPVDVKED